MTDCECVAGYTAESEGGACKACEAGMFKREVGTAECERCPANSESSSGSALCQCSAGFQGEDGGECAACEAGTYKAGTGAGECSVCPAGTYTVGTGAWECSVCPAGTTSASGSSALGECKCLVGYGGTSDGEACTMCTAGMFKREVGMAECQFCPENSESSSGSAWCYCSAGFWGNERGACDACSDCASSVTFTATLSMALTE